jgi:hypothetical protein
LGKKREKRETKDMWVGERRDEERMRRKKTVGDVSVEGEEEKQ